MSVIRANLKPATIERLGRYAKIRLGIGADDLINEALDKLENSKASREYDHGQEGRSK